MSESEESLPLNDDLVVAYLRDNPDFFKTHPTLIADLNFPHETGDAVSLIQRQVELLRDNQQTTRQYLAVLGAHAKTNEALLARVRALSVSAVAAGTPRATLEALSRTIIEDFGLDSVYLVAEQGKWPVSGDNIISLSPEELVTLRNAVESLAVFVGRPPRKMKELLFSGDVDNVASIAMSRFTYKGGDTYLIIGSRNDRHFTNDMGTDLIAYIGNLLEALLSR